MTGATDRGAAQSQRAASKFAARRVELARAALSTLSELGYARSSLREIAQNSQFSHGVLHYYFKDKTDLLICSIREFKLDAIARFEAALAPAQDLSSLFERLDAAIEAWICVDGATNRFWYDLRAQALFDARFRTDVVEIYTMMQEAIGRFFARVGALTGVAPPMPASVAYAIFDGLFQQCMLRHAAGDDAAIADLQVAIRTVVGQLLRQGPA